MFCWGEGDIIYPYLIVKLSQGPQEFIICPEPSFSQMWKRVTSDWNVSDGQRAILPWTQARLGLSVASSKNIPWQG